MRPLPRLARRRHVGTGPSQRRAAAAAAHWGTGRKLSPAPRRPQRRHVIGGLPAGGARYTSESRGPLTPRPCPAPQSPLKARLLPSGPGTTVKPVRTPVAIFGSLGVCIYVPAGRHWLISYSSIHLT